MAERPRDEEEEKIRKWRSLLNIERFGHFDVPHGLVNVSGYPEEFDS